MRAFISYCHADKKLYERLKTHLKSLEREKLVEPWSDYEILPGSNIDDEIKHKMEESELFLLLISPDFIASDYCFGKELDHAINRHYSGTAKVIPIILEPCNLESISELLKLKALPDEAVPISTFNNHNVAFSQVIEGLKLVISDYNKLLDSNATTKIPKDFKSPHSNCELKQNERIHSDFDPSRIQGTVLHNYSNTDGICVLGEGEWKFSTKWGKRDKKSIYCYNFESNIDGIALAMYERNNKMIEFLNKINLQVIKEFDFSSKSRSPKLGEIVIWKNTHGNYLATKVCDIKDRDRNDTLDEVTLEYRMISF